METVQTKSGKEIQQDKAIPFAAHHKFLIVGGGTGGITVAAQIMKK